MSATISIATRHAPEKDAIKDGVSIPTITVIKCKIVAMKSKVHLVEHNIVYIYFVCLNVNSQNVCVVNICNG